MDLDTRGLASIFVNLTSHSEVRGEFGRGRSPTPKHIAPMCGETARSGIMRSISAATEP